MPDVWEFAAVFAKFLLYLGIAGVAGASLCLLLYRDNRRYSVTMTLGYFLLSALLGFHAALLAFGVQVGMINREGIGGMFDWTMASILLDTSQGEVAVYRLFGFLLQITAGAALFWKLRGLQQAPQEMLFRLLFIASGLGLVALALSFRVSGHVSILGLPSQFAIGLHVTAVLFWVGSLVPLMLLLGDYPNVAELKLTLLRFGRDARGLLVVLAASGSLVLWNLYWQVEDFFSSPYGLAVALKLLLVLAMLGLAARHKFKLVPALDQGGGVAMFRRSLWVEIATAVIILLVTAYLSTVVGPGNH